MDVLELLRTASDLKASDLHLVIDSPPLVRVNGELQELGNVFLTPHDIDVALTQLTDEEQRQKFLQTKELDFACTMDDYGRLRCNVARQMHGISLAIRLLPPAVPTIDELELPQILKDLAVQPRGLLLVTGPTGSGKSTTLAAMLQHLNQTGGHHIITIEDPIEYVHQRVKCAITQRQLGEDTNSYPSALKHILRQNPDVIMLGEIRDPDTAAAALSVAETGHLVLSTSHAPSAPQAVERVIDLFAPQERHLAEARLASLLVAVLCQTLVPRASGKGRIAAMEVLIANPAAKSMIRESKVHNLHNVITTNRESGMITMDESLAELYKAGTITLKTVFAYCNDPTEVKKYLGVNVRTISGK
ncbi:type IV pilus twitching motility protein PilT [Dehalogenimonas etheniformans]|uniref:Type IV pili twitching motility protein PilT n=1 Tax=Dehalogenimonas etheniformans TaxID=1536648 RepID=A0A2P5PA12_9CHLR|nr:PilT/PilU family type 4a pilus ATPase [Dehalogenimonas etheniformans]PPD59132.1 type IV pili twitching motility protein PilT [Dehalogenimonas etheniformans]QNT75824.1 PilT/PilU family type 4a pilus ATPase [Dehalogenimonas etheniformans]